MGYAHYWIQGRAFSDQEWKLILGETRRIIAKAQRGIYYSGKEDFASQTGLDLDEQGFRQGFNEEGAWRTFPHPEQPIPQHGEPILLAGPNGRGKPRLNKYLISLNGKQPQDYESFVLGKEPPRLHSDHLHNDELSGSVKTEYRPYDAVVVSILAAARVIAPSAIKVRSDGGDEAIRYMF